MIKSMQELTTAIREVVSYAYDSEERDYQENGGDGHIYLVLEELRAFTTKTS